MVRTILFAATAALTASVAASTIVFAQGVQGVGTIAVTAELDDVDANALTYWPTIADDLRTALESRSMPFRSETGADISVQLQDISLSGSEVLTGEGEFNTISGWVYFRAPGDAVPFAQEQISLTATTAQVGISEAGITVPGQPMFYSSLVDGFALATLRRLAVEDPTLDVENRKSQEGEVGGADAGATDGN